MDEHITYTLDTQACPFSLRCFGYAREAIPCHILHVRINGDVSAAVLSFHKSSPRLQPQRLRLRYAMCIPCHGAY